MEWEEGILANLDELPPDEREFRLKLVELVRSYNYDPQSQELKEKVKALTWEYKVQQEVKYKRKAEGGI